MATLSLTYPLTSAERTLLAAFGEPRSDVTRLTEVLTGTIALPLADAGIETLEDLYECVANLGSHWFRSIPGLDQTTATALVAWLAEHASLVGEVTERFFVPRVAEKSPAKETLHGEWVEAAPTGTHSKTTKKESASGASSHRETANALRPLEELSVASLSETLSGVNGINRAPAQYASLEANNDLEAIHSWLNARASNDNTRGNYRKEAERFLLWCLFERERALSSIKASDAAQYLRWLEQLGRTPEREWATRWRLPQDAWIGPKNMPRTSSAWRPFNGPLMSTSRRNAIVVVRQLFNFLKKTGYLVFNPFDQVSPKVPLLKGEGVPQAFADRSLTENQWEEILAHLAREPEGWPKARLTLILMMGKGLGMRASEMIDAKAGWVVSRRTGLKTHTFMEIVGKGAKVRRLPLSKTQVDIVNRALIARGFTGVEGVPPDTPLLINLGRGPKPNQAMTRSGLYRTLVSFFERVANDIATERPLDAAKLKASSTHWLRHTFAVNALAEMSVNVVQHAMGHASVATTGRYLAPEEETLVAAMEKLKPL